MQLKLTWRIRNHSDLDLLVSDEQRIIETKQVLVEKGILDEETVESVQYIKSLRTHNQVNVLITYNEAGIYSGDILEI